MYRVNDKKYSVKRIDSVLTLIVDRNNFCSMPSEHAGF
jgi:hypothetical protein